MSLARSARDVTTDERLSLLPSTEDDSQFSSRSQREESPHAMTFLFASHFLSTWLSRGFELGAVLVLATSYPGSLLELSLYAMLRAISAMIFAPLVAKYIDRGNRLQVLRQSIIWQRVSVIVSCLLFWPLLDGRLSNLNTWSRSTLLCGVMLLAGVEKLASMACTISIERDWVIVIASGDTVKLETINSQMRRIDLFCKLISPFIVALIEGVSAKMALAYIAGTNIAFAVIEYNLVESTYQSFPNLALKIAASNTTSSPHSNTERDDQGTAWFISWCQACKRNVVTYASQEAFYPSLCLSALYLTSLSFGGQMVAYLLAMGFTGPSLGILRVGSTICELSATWLAPILMSKIGVIRSGLWFLNAQVLSLGVAILSLCIGAASTSASLSFVGGVALSRIGLWGFDLSSQIFIQGNVREEDRAAFSTTEWALQSAFEMIAFLITTAFPDVHQFKISATASFLSVAIAAIIYARFVYSERGHLFHSKRRAWRRMSTS